MRGFPDVSVAQASERIVRDHQMKYAQTSLILQQVLLSLCVSRPFYIVFFYQLIIIIHNFQLQFVCFKTKQCNAEPLLYHYQSVYN